MVPTIVKNCKQSMLVMERFVNLSLGFFLNFLITVLVIDQLEKAFSQFCAFIHSKQAHQANMQQGVCVNQPPL